MQRCYKNHPFLSVFLGIYVALLLLSWAVQWLLPVHEFPNKYLSEKYVQVEGKQVQLSFFDIENRGGEGPVFILLPDIYQGPDFLLPLAASGNFPGNSLIIHYPETDADGNFISHSVQVRAKLVAELIDSLALQDIVLIGEGYGGLAAMELAASTANIRGLILISSLGVQELHFLGNHVFNRSLYSILKPFSFAFKYAVPHFGYYQYQPVQKSYIRGLLELDQRNVRGQLSKIDIPVLILHPENDQYVPVSVSEETSRLLPQSRLFITPGNHRAIVEHPGVYAEAIAQFFTNLTDGIAVHREAASAARKQLAAQNFDPAFISSPSMVTLFTIFILLFLFTSVSEDLACISGGLLAASGLISFWFAVFACFSGMMIIDTIIYLMGKKIGNPILKKPPLKWLIKEKDVIKAERMFEMYGVQILFVSRFIPGTRLPVYLSAGLLKTKTLFFLFFFFLSLVVYIPALVWISSVIGLPIMAMIEIYQDYVLWIFAGAILFIYLLLKLIIPLFTVTGRRNFVVRLEKFRRVLFNRQ